ncbi:MAG TPA: hypothetical protein PLH75_10200 [Amaricoccus sp.]|nr:hypothetical protein [Amaricoccus sp.]
MSVPYDLKIVPALTFRPLSPVLAQLIENAYRDLAQDGIRPAEAVPAPVPQPAEAGPANPSRTLDLRA